MKGMSAAEIKRGERTTRQLTPREGTKLRELFDVFQSNVGKPISVAPRNTKEGMRQRQSIDQLKNFYGMDIRHWQEPNYYWFVGEWFGAVYVDFLNSENA